MGCGKPEDLRGGGGQLANHGLPALQLHAAVCRGRAAGGLKDGLTDGSHVLHVGQKRSEGARRRGGIEDDAATALQDLGRGRGRKWRNPPPPFFIALQFGRKRLSSHENPYFSISRYMCVYIDR